MPSYDYMAIRPDPAPTPSTKRDDRRPVGVAATILGLGLALVWPPVLGLVAGIAGALWAGEWWPVRLGLVMGVAVGVVASFGVLLSSYVIGRVLHRPEPVAYPNAITVQYSEPFITTRDIGLVPMFGYGVTLDATPARDVAWMLRGLADYGAPTAQRFWVGQMTPSGRRVDERYWHELVSKLKKSGLLVGMARGRSGVLVTRDRGVMAARLHLDDGDPDLWCFDDGDLEARARAWSATARPQYPRLPSSAA